MIRFLFNFICFFICFFYLIFFNDQYLRAYERFTGNQIAKLQKTSPSDIENTERIALVSSFVATLLIGKHAPIDISDGSGMNLLNLQTKQWEESLLKATGVSDLGKKLGAPVPSDTVVGEISNYFVSR